MWRDIERVAARIEKAWVILGDFNCVLSKDERVGTPVRDYEMEPFRRCVTNYGLEDLKAMGCFYT